MSSKPDTDRPDINSLVIFLHGVGANGEDLAGLGRAWAGRLPNTVFESPDAPEPFDQGGDGRQWFSLAGVTPANRPQRLVAARDAFDRLLRSIVASHGFDGRLDRVALVGFSQGSIMALDAVASGRWPVRALVAFAGRLSTPPPLAPAATPVLLLHGAADPVIPLQESIDALSILESLGVDVKLHRFPRVSHGIPPEGADIAAAFLVDRLGAA